MAQLPNVKLQIHPSMFDLMMAILERNVASEDVPTHSSARNLIEKRMRFSRLYPGKNGGQYVSALMYENEAAEMIWQLLYACAGTYPLEKEYSKELKHGGAAHD